MRTRRFALFAASLLVGLSSLGALSRGEMKELREELDTVVSSTTLDPEGREYRNAVVLLESPSHSFRHTAASGIGSVDDRTPMSPDHQFYIESLTKSFTATIVLQLAEEGRLGERGLDSTLGDLKVFPPEVLDQLHRIGDASYGPGITVGQLVRHRTGMKNFTYEDAGGPDSGSTDLGFARNSFLGVLVGDPERGYAGLMQCARSHLPEGADLIQNLASNGIPEECDPSSYYFYRPPFQHWDLTAWKRDPSDRFAGLLNFYLSGMNETAHFPPGEDFKYTDTNYLVLGLLIEKVTGNSLHAELRRRIFDPLNMESSYMSYATDPPAGKWRRELSELWALDGIPIVKLGINRSMMWSDAGIVSTVGDLNTFVRALVAGKLFEDETTLQRMIDLPDGVEMGYGYGVGISRKGDDTVLFHTGGAASWWIYHMKSGITFIGTMNDATDTGRERLGRVHGGFQAALKTHGIEMRSPF